VALVASGMMLAPVLAAAAALRKREITAAVVNVPVIKPLDAATVTRVSAAARLVVTAENHSIVGGLGSARAEVLAEAGLGTPLRRIGLRDTFAEGCGTASSLFANYGLSAQAIASTVWQALGRPGAEPLVTVAAAADGEYSPV